MAENKQVPMWQDYLGQMPTNNIQAPYAAGTKTLGHLEMDSANRRAAQALASQEKMQAMSIASQQAMHRDDIALSREDLELRRAAQLWEQNYKMLTYEAAQAALQQATGQLSQYPTGGYYSGQTPGSAINDFSVKNVFDATGDTASRIGNRSYSDIIFGR